MATKEWYLRNKDKPEFKARIKRNTQNWQEANPEKYMLGQARGRAKLNNIPFDLGVEDIQIPVLCPILGIELKFGEGRAKPYSPTLDRIIPSLGYVKGNVQVISLRANLMKSDANPEELIKFSEWVMKTNKTFLDNESF